jgi:hypothetical protein
MPKDNSFLERIESEIEDSEVSLRQYEINTYPADFTLEVLVSKWNKGEIEKRGFQRRYVWNQIRASKLIESFLLGLPVPPVYLYQEKNTAKLLVVDGHQRLRSIVFFFSGWFGDTTENPDQEVVPFTLVGLNERSPYMDATFQSLADSDSDAFGRLKNSVLRSFIMKQTHPQDDTSIFEIFSRLNTGGMALMPQEIRNCILEGPFNELLKTLNKYSAWRNIVGTKIEDKRMRDIELILRFFALFYNSAKYEKPMKDFLNRFMTSHRRSPMHQEGDSSVKMKHIEAEQKIYLKKQREFKKLFEKTSELVVKYLGAKPFHIKRGLNAAVFDSVFTAFAHHFRNLSLDNIKPNQNEVKSMRAKYERLLSNETYLGYVTSATTDKEVVPRRIELARKILFR